MNDEVSGMQCNELKDLHLNMCVYVELLQQSHKHHVADAKKLSL